MTLSKATTAIGVHRRAVAWFTDHGVTVERVLSDNGSSYKSHAWRDACTELGITPKHTSALPAPNPTAKSRDSEPSPTAGPTPGSTNQKLNDEQPYPPGSTSTVTTDPTPPSEADHP